MVKPTPKSPDIKLGVLAAEIEAFFRRHTQDLYDLVIPGSIHARVSTPADRALATTSVQAGDMRIVLEAKVRGGKAAELDQMIAGPMFNILGKAQSGGASLYACHVPVIFSPARLGQERADLGLPQTFTIIIRPG